MELKALRSSFMTALKACGWKKDLHQVNRIHAQICNSGLFLSDVYLGNTLVSVYAKCGALKKAQNVLHDLPFQDVVSWNALIAGYAQHDCGKEALCSFQQMQSEGLSPNEITYACTLKACGIAQDGDMGEKIHNEIASRGILQTHALLGSALVDMYAKCGVLMKAQKVHDELLVRTVVSWSALIAGYVEHGCGKEALSCFQQMQSEGLSPNSITYACTLKACGIAKDLDMGQRIHDDIASQGLLHKHALLGGALVDMYVKCGVLTKAQKALDELPFRDVVSWSVMIAGYAQLGCGKEALACFQQMRSEGLTPDAITYGCTLRACGAAQDVDMGERTHNEIASQGLLQKPGLLGNALIDMYAKCSVLTKAQKVFDELPVRDVVTWSTLIAGYVQHGYGKEGLRCFQCMLSEGISPNAISYACALKACGVAHDINMGERFHDEIARQGLLQKNVLLGGALVDMYAKCGAVLKAQTVLDELPVRNVVTWNALITGFAQQGQGQEAVDCFQRMQSEGFLPNDVTWNALIGGYSQQGLAEQALECFRWMQHEGTSPTAIILATVPNECIHSGLVDEGQMLFDGTSKQYGIAPDKEHYSCMVDLLGHARHFDKPIGAIKMMPSSDCPSVWHALLAASQKWGNVELGRLAFKCSRIR